MPFPIIPPHPFLFISSKVVRNVLGGGGGRKYGWPAAEVKKFAPRRDSTGGVGGGGVLTVNGKLCPMGYHILSFPLHPTPNRYFACNSQIRMQGDQKGDRLPFATAPKDI
jgi:hypothetical protein